MVIWWIVGLARHYCITMSFGHADYLFGNVVMAGCSFPKELNTGSGAFATNCGPLSVFMHVKIAFGTTKWSKLKHATCAAVDRAVIIPWANFNKQSVMIIVYWWCCWTCTAVQEYAWGQNQADNLLGTAAIHACILDVLSLESCTRNLNSLVFVICHMVWVNFVLHGIVNWTLSWMYISHGTARQMGSFDEEPISSDFSHAICILGLHNWTCIWTV